MHCVSRITAMSIGLGDAVCGVRETEAKFLDGPQEDIPQEEVVVVCPRTSKPEESLVEMDAWTRPAALLAAGYNIEQVIAADWSCLPPLSLLCSLIG